MQTSDKIELAENTEECKVEDDSETDGKIGIMRIQ